MWRRRQKDGVYSSQLPVHLSHLKLVAEVRGTQTFANDVDAVGCTEVDQQATEERHLDIAPLRTLFNQHLDTLIWSEESVLGNVGAYRDDYVVDEIAPDSYHNDQMVACYATAIRRGGEINGEALGVLGVMFDWDEQARGIVQEEPNLDEAEWQKYRVMLLDSGKRVIASSDGVDLLQRYPLETMRGDKGHYFDRNGLLVVYAKTIGYQEYDGLGWYAVIAAKN